MLAAIYRNTSDLLAGATPLSHLKAADLDEAGDPAYYGFVSTAGEWAVLRLNDAEGTIRFAHAKSGYSDAWINRTSLDYYRLDQIGL